MKRKKAQQHLHAAGFSLSKQLGGGPQYLFSTANPQLVFSSPAYKTMFTITLLMSPRVKQYP